MLDALTGAEVELTEAEKWVVQAMEDLADRLAGEEDGACRTVAAALARKVHALGVHVKADDGQTPQDALYEAFAWFLGAEAGGWEYELPTADGLRRGIEQWVEKATSAKGVWKSQAAAIRALVLHSASPQEARQAAQAAFNARQGKTRVQGNPDSCSFTLLSRLRCSLQPGVLPQKQQTPEAGYLPQVGLILAGGGYCAGRGYFSRGGGFSATAELLWWASWPPRSRRSMEGVASVGFF